MSRAACRLLGARVRLGALHRARIVDVLVDDAGEPVLARIVLLPDGDVAYLAAPVLTDSAFGALTAPGPHVLLDESQARYYEGRAGGWISERDVTEEPIRGIVAA